MYKEIKRKTSTAKEVFDDFLAKKELTGLSPRTIEGYHDATVTFLNEENIINVSDISKHSFYAHIENLRVRGVSATSINHSIASIRVFLYYLMEENMIQPFKIELIKQQEPTFRLYSDEELSKLAKMPSKDAKFPECRMHAIVSLIMATGARASTVLNIHKEDIDFTNRVITFRHMKTKKSLIVPMSDSLANILKRYINEWAIESDFLFPDVTGNMMSYNALRCSFDRYCIKREVEHKGVHSLRHNFARNWVVNNGNVFQLQRVLGHSTLDMTRKYVRLFENDLQNDYETYSLLDSINKNKDWRVRRSSEA